MIQTARIRVGEPNSPSHITGQKPRARIKRGALRLSHGEVLPTISAKPVGVGAAALATREATPHFAHLSRICNNDA